MFIFRVFDCIEYRNVTSSRFYLCDFAFRQCKTAIFRILPRTKTGRATAIELCLQFSKHKILLKKFFKESVGVVRGHVLLHNLHTVVLPPPLAFLPSDINTKVSYCATN